MGDFIIYQHNKVDEKKHNALLSTLSSQGSNSPLVIKDDFYSIVLYKKNTAPVENFIKKENDNFCASSGCFFYKNMNGQKALNRFFEDFDPDFYNPSDFIGIFTLIIKKKGRLFIITDPMGASRVFHTENYHIWSSSFLAIAENIEKLSLDKQGIYEYCFQETNYGSTTPLKEIKTADSLCYFELIEDGILSNTKNITIDFNISSLPYEDLVERHRHLLQKQMQSVVSSYNGNIATALSGGYDSRLMLSLAKNTGIDPDVYVYGQDKSPDVTVAKSIAAGEGFDIKHINKASHPKPSVDEYQEIVRNNFYALDGFPNESIFDFGANMKTRRDRAKAGTLVLNGGGGEIYRNFFYLPDRNYKVSDLLNSFYSRYTKDFCTNNFNEDVYREILSEKIKTALQIKKDHLTRTELEYVYPAFRLRYWTSKDNSNNNRIGSFLTPFICYETIHEALKIPLKYKTHGKFQGDLINAVSPKMASYFSDYGYRFNEPVPFKNKLKNNLTIYRPTFLRRYSFAIQHKLAELRLPDTLNENYLNPILKNSTFYMNHYFKIDNIKNAELRGRVLTLEYLFQHLKV